MPFPLPGSSRTTPGGPTLPLVAVKIALHHGDFYYAATTGEQSWRGAISVPTRGAALLDIFSEIRADIGDPIRLLISLPKTSRVWQHVADLAAIGCLVECHTSADLPLKRSAAAELAALIADRLPAQPPPMTEELSVATDGSVRRGGSGYGWLASDGRYGLRGNDSPRTIKRQAVLLSELGAINDAVRPLKAQPLALFSDSTTAVEAVQQWAAGRDVLPAGCQRTILGRPSPLLAMQERIYENRDRLSVRWIKAHCGDPLNEGADGLARLASRYGRGDSGLTKREYAERAKGLARSFSSAFSHQKSA